MSAAQPGFESPGQFALQQLFQKLIKTAEEIIDGLVESPLVNILEQNKIKYDNNKGKMKEKGNVMSQ